jgi:hypothetical protein
MRKTLLVIALLVLVIGLPVAVYYSMHSSGSFSQLVRLPFVSAPASERKVIDAQPVYREDE